MAISCGDTQLWLCYWCPSSLTNQTYSSSNVRKYRSLSFVVSLLTAASSGASREGLAVEDEIPGHETV